LGQYNLLDHILHCWAASFHAAVLP
jgi:hypothetical protein